MSSVVVAGQRMQLQGRLSLPRFVLRHDIDSIPPIEQISTLQVVFSSAGTIRCHAHAGRPRRSSDMYIR